MMRTTVRIDRGQPTVKPAAVSAAVAMMLTVAGGSLAHDFSHGSPFERIEPEALQILKGMTDYVGSLQEFSIHTENTFDEVLLTGQKIQLGFSTDVVVKRPNKIRAERVEGTAHQLLIYDSAKLFMHQAKAGFYATIDVPDNIDDFLHFARDRLDLVPPAGDMVFSNAFELLTAGVTSGFVVGETEIDGVRCYHLAFTSPVVDWQVWIAKGDRPVPYRYVLTTRDDPAHPQFVTGISDWNVTPRITDGTFVFDPPANAMEIDFVQVDNAAGAAR